MYSLAMACERYGTSTRWPETFIATVLKANSFFHCKSLLVLMQVLMQPAKKN